MFSILAVLLGCGFLQLNNRTLQNLWSYYSRPPCLKSPAVTKRKPFPASRQTRFPLSRTNPFPTMSNKLVSHFLEQTRFPLSRTNPFHTFSTDPFPTFLTNPFHTFSTNPFPTFSNKPVSHFLEEPVSHFPQQTRFTLSRTNPFPLVTPLPEEGG